MKDVLIRTFNWCPPEEDERFGIGGWKPAWFKDQAVFDPVQVGFAAAHDCLEHGLRDHGHFHEELMAFGAMILTRGQNDYWGGQVGNNPRKMLGGEIVDLYHDLHEKPYVPALPKGFKGLPRTQEDAGYWVRGVIEGACAVSERSADSYSGESLTEAEIRSWQGWLEYGYMRALRKYDGWQRIMRDTFDQVDEAFTERSKSGDYGSKLRLRIYWKRAICEAEVIEDFSAY